MEHWRSNRRSSSNPKELSSQESSSIGSTRPLATSDDGKVDKEPKYWFNTRTGLMLECSFKFPTEGNPDVARAGLENGVLKMVIRRTTVLGEGTKWIPSDSGSRYLRRQYLIPICEESKYHRWTPRSSSSYDAAVSEEKQYRQSSVDGFQGLF